MSQKADEKETDESYVVEEILEKRERNGETQYLVKWKDYPSEDNTWEAEKHLQCTDLITKFNDSQDSATKKLKENALKNLRGFARGIDAEKIVAATKVAGEIIYLVKWQGIDESDLVTAEEANKKCPHVVIQFLEKHIELTPNIHSDQSDN